MIWSWTDNTTGVLLKKRFVSVEDPRRGESTRSAQTAVPIGNPGLPFEIDIDQERLFF
jgi:hypothetical protein